MNAETFAVDSDGVITFAPPFIRSAYNYDADQVSRETGLACLDPSKTQQQFVEDSDINTIVRRFGLTGELPENPNPPVYADFDEIFDFQTSHNAVIDARARFMEFPAALRARFHNDPQELLVFVENAANRPEAEALGLVKPKPPEPAPPAPPTS